MIPRSAVLKSSRKKHRTSHARHAIRKRLLATRPLLLAAERSAKKEIKDARQEKQSATASASTPECWVNIKDYRESIVSRESQAPSLAPRMDR